MIIPLQIIQAEIKPVKTLIHSLKPLFLRNGFIKPNTMIKEITNPAIPDTIASVSAASKDIGLPHSF